MESVIAAVSRRVWVDAMPRVVVVLVLLGVCGSAQAAVVGGWSQLPLPRVAPEGSSVTRLGELVGVSCVSRRWCVAVGSVRATPARRQGGLVERWGGRRWSIEGSFVVPGRTRVFIDAVACRSERWCLAVGSAVEGDGVLTQPFSMLWDGSRWKLVSVPTPTSTRPVELSAISCTSTEACVAVGAAGQIRDAQRPVIEEWNGHRWRDRPQANVVGELDSVDCTAATTCTALGSPILAGTPPDPAFLASYPALIERRSGAGWTRESLPIAAGALASLPDAVTCLSARACVSVGASIVTSATPDQSGTYVPLEASWRDLSWQPAQPPAATTTAAQVLRAVQCTRHGICVSGGVYVDPGHGTAPLLARFDGKTWAVTHLPVKTDDIRTVDGISCVSGWCIAVGGGFSATTTTGST